jgi:hypothetical protein
VHAHRVVVDLLPPAHVWQRLVELRAGGDVLDPVLVEVLPEHAVEVEEHGVGVERLAVVELHPAAQRELPRGVAHGLPGQREPRHRLALRVDVHQTLEDLADVGRADRAHADPGIHVVRVVRHRDDELRLGVDSRGVDGRGQTGVEGGHGQYDEGGGDEDGGASHASITAVALLLLDPVRSGRGRPRPSPHRT